VADKHPAGGHRISFSNSDFRDFIMKLSTGRNWLVAISVMAVLGMPSLGAFDQAQPPSWWKSEEFRAALNLTTDQSTRIEHIFQTTVPELRQEMDELDRLEVRLSKLIESEAEEALIAREIDRVETARANVNKTRALMLVRMRRVLTAEQRTQMRALQEEARRRSRSTPDSNRRPGF
jgi:Spy/CpxP family protein refolding chaperone